MINAQLLLAGTTATGSADNGTATATAAAATGTRHVMTGVVAQYSAAVASVKTITFKRGVTTLCVIRWDFTNGPAIIALPGVLRGQHGEAVSCELEASGAGGTTGSVYLFYFPS